MQVKADWNVVLCDQPQQWYTTHAYLCHVVPPHKSSPAQLAPLSTNLCQVCASGALQRKTRIAAQCPLAAAPRCLRALQSAVCTSPVRETGRKHLPGLSQAFTACSSTNQGGFNVHDRCSPQSDSFHPPPRSSRVASELRESFIIFCFPRCMWNS